MLNPCIGEALLQKKTNCKVCGLPASGGAR